ncbi:Uncharacterized protein APZ42_008000, partial [Daphnia magna]
MFGHDTAALKCNLTLQSSIPAQSRFPCPSYSPTIPQSFLPTSFVRI